VNIDNEKMSKSLGNFRTLRDVVSSAADVRAFRYFVVSAQYRAPLNFTPDTISVAAKSVARLDKLMASLRDRLADAEAAQVKDCAGFENRCTQCIEQFTVAMNDDLNTPRAVAAIFGLAKEAERALKRKELSAKDAQAALGCLHRLDEVLGIFYEVPRVGALDQPSQKSSLVADVQQQLVKLEQAPKAVADIAVRRFDHKQRAEYAEADQLRAELTSLGYIVKDRKDGFDLYRVG
jgi:cysteinyl-tRNA synthetase